jgi:hypothetical protein
MKVGFMELVVDTASTSWTDLAYGSYFKKFHASIIPQAVAVWCRQLGHQVSYATYYGQRDPVSLLPDGLDVVFITSYTQASALAKGQILESMPFSFYYTPYLVTTVPHYPATEYYDQLIDIYSAMTSNAMLARRFVTKSTLGFSLFHALRTFAMRQDLAVLRLLRKTLAADAQFRAFHEGSRASLPEFYHRRYEQKLGRYAHLISRAERTPELEKPASAAGPTVSLAT